MAGGGGVGGWGFGGMQPQMPPRNPQQQNYEAMFNSLFPINGMVTGMYNVGEGGVWSKGRRLILLCGIQFPVHVWVCNRLCWEISPCKI